MGNSMQKFLFTTLPSNDLGLLTRSLPVASELAKRGHKVAFCSPAEAPSKLIAEAGFDNLFPKHPLYHLMAAELSFRGLYRLVKSEQLKRDFGNFFNFLSKLIGAIPIRLAPITSEVWNMDHMGAMGGMLNENFVPSTQVLTALETIASNLCWVPPAVGWLWERQEK